MALSLAFQWIVFAAVAILWSSGKRSNLEMEKMILDRILNKDVYDPRIRPSGINGTGGPVLVRPNMFIRRIADIDDVKMEYSVQITFRESWVDPRLNHSDHGDASKYRTLTDPSKMWIPDVFFSNEISGHFHNILSPNVLLRIFPNGSVLHSTRISMRLSCPMDLHNFPMDRQVCSIVLASYGYTTEDMVLLWKENDPVQVTKNLGLQQFTFDGFDVHYCKSKTNTGEYSCLKVDLFLSRDFNYYFVQMYIPSVIPVLLSWAPFWIDEKSTTARFAVWVTTFLTLFVGVLSFSEKLPAVSYNKAIDVWSGVCFVFLYAALLELAIVAHVIFTESRRKRVSPHENDAKGAAADIKKPILSNGGEEVAERTRLSILNRLLKKYRSRGQRIDVGARFLFPFMFVLFNVVYWSVYCRKF